MVKKNVSTIRNSKPFYPFDLIIYCALALIVTIAVSAVFFAGKTSENLGVYILFDNETAAEYRFLNDKLTINGGFESHFSVEDGEIYFYPDENSREHYNLIILDGENKTVYVKEATCAGHDCLSQKITVSGGFIYCAPHKLKIVPIKISDPVSG